MLTAKEDLQSRPEAVSVVIAVACARLAQKERNATPTDAEFERYTAMALQKWDELVAKLGGKLREQAIAEEAVERLRATGEWGSVLRGDAS